MTDYVNMPGQSETVDVGAHKRYYADWRKAAEASSLSRRAISKPWRTRAPDSVLKLPVLVAVVKPIDGDAYLVYWSRPGVPIEPRPHIPTGLIDMIERRRGWMSYDGES